MSVPKLHNQRKLDVIFDPDSKIYQKKLRQSSESLLNALRAHEIYPDSLSIREGIMLGFPPEHCTSFMVSPALMCAQLGEPEYESGTEAHRESQTRMRERRDAPKREIDEYRNKILNRWWIK
jgi:hypothetical protein